MATRSCPHCGAPSGVAPDDDLWPLSWTCSSCRKPLAQSGGFALLAPALDQVNEGIELENFELLSEAEENSFWFRSRNELIRWLVERYAPRAERALELGCGTGYTLTALRQALPAAKLAGSELHSDGLVAARARHGGDIELLQLDARHCHLAATLDLIGAFDVLEHIEDDTWSSPRSGGP